MIIDFRGGGLISTSMLFADVVFYTLEKLNFLSASHYDYNLKLVYIFFFMGTYFFSTVIDSIELNKNTYVRIVSRMLLETKTGKLMKNNLINVI